MTKTQQLNAWLDEVMSAKNNQPETSWTIARMKLTYLSPQPELGAVVTDVVSAAGACNAQVTEAFINESVGRIELETTFNNFELRGESHLFGKFEVTLQEGKQAKGKFWQKNKVSLFPLQGEWHVPFQVNSKFGLLIPRPTDPDVTLKSASPGEFTIPPIGSWFEKWDPISMVDINDPDGPTVVTIDHAMHCMLNKGNSPDIPPFYVR